MKLNIKVVVAGISVLLGMQVQAMRETPGQALQRSKQEMAKLFPQTSASGLATSALTSQSAKNNYFMRRILKGIEENNIDKVRNELNQGLKQGFDINTQEDDNGFTLLHMAAFGDNSAIVELLLKAGANPNIKSNTGLISLDAALLSDRLNSLDILKMLIDAGADVNTKDNQGLSLLDWSISGSPSMVKALLKLPGINLPEKKEATALLAKLRNKNPESEQERMDLQEKIRLLSPYAMALTGLSADAIVKNIDLYRNKLHLLPQELQEEVKRRLGLAGDLIYTKARLKSTTSKYI